MFIKEETNMKHYIKMVLLYAVLAMAGRGQ